MHKDDAAKLFNALSEGTRVKIVKVLYHNKELSENILLNLLNCSYSMLSLHLSILLEVNLIKERIENEEKYYSCNHELVNELMSFIARPCGCVSK